MEGANRLGNVWYFLTFSSYLMKIKNLLLLLCISLWLSSCAGIPEDFEQVPSSAWQQPHTTSLGAFFADWQPEDKSLSGVALMPVPKTAFRTRYALANQAEKTLDLQYYLWKGDTTGRLLLHQVFEAADRGVQVRLLIDDIFHNGRDFS